MKKHLAFIIVWFALLSYAQDVSKAPLSGTFDFNYFYGNVANHNANALIFIADHPEGMVLRWNKKTFGAASWQERFNYPDLGVSFIYQDFKNNYLGDNFSVYGHYNFYFLKRNLMLGFGQGIAYTTHPYDAETNPRNVAYGSNILASTYLMFNYKKERLFNTRLGVQAGLLFIHYSNAKIKSPNAGSNTVSANAGIVYSIGPENVDFIHTEKNNVRYKESIGYNIMLRTGINQSSVIGTDQYMFYIPVFYIDKRIGELSALQMGTELFVSQFLKENIRYTAIAFPEKNVDANADYKRVGLFVGHNLFINKISVETQLGYYLYYPYEYEKRIYFRVGVKKFVGKRFFGMISVKTHGAKAEALEFGVGLRLGGHAKNRTHE